MSYFLLALLMSSQAGPVLYWKGDDGPSPTTALDSSGNGYNGTYSNGATTSTQLAPLHFPNTGSFVFDGSNDRVDAPSFSWPSGGPITVAFWSLVATGEVTTSSVFTIGNLDWPNNRVQAHVPWNDRILFWDYGNSGTGRIITWYETYLDKWTHVALVSEGNGGLLKAIYLDGVQVAAQPVSDGPDTPLTGFTLGTWPLSVSNFHRGKVDDFRIYNRVLTPSQVQLLAAGYTEPAPPSSLGASAGSGAVQLTWTAAAGASAYTLKRGLVAGGPYSTLATVPSPGTTYTDTNVSAGTVYYYVVTTVGVNESGVSNESSAVPGPASPAPPAPPPQNITLKGCGAIGVEALLMLLLLRAGIRRRGRRD
ncbi:MAG TPA: LamG domain-containing protein [Planctomycetota bacterium]|nr:LamG domain-containing protein [Planctomycetota bacterium]